MLLFFSGWFSCFQPLLILGVVGLSAAFWSDRTSASLIMSRVGKLRSNLILACMSCAKLIQTCTRMPSKLFRFFVTAENPETAGECSKLKIPMVLLKNRRIYESSVGKLLSFSQGLLSEARTYFQGLFLLLGLGTVPSHHCHTMDFQGAIFAG